MSPIPLKAGDTVQCTDNYNYSHLIVGNEYTVEAVGPDHMVFLMGDPVARPVPPEYFSLVVPEDKRATEMGYNGPQLNPYVYEDHGYQPKDSWMAGGHKVLSLDELDARLLPTPAECASLANLLNAADLGQLTEADAVTVPQHYARFKIEPIRFICENNLNFFQGNILKYVLRYDAKNGLEDLKKAQRYLTMFIKFIEGDPNWWRKEEATVRVAA